MKTKIKFVSALLIICTMIISSCEKSQLVEIPVVKKDTQPTLKKSESKLLVELPFTKEMELKVIEVVTPVRETIEQLFKKDETGTYLEYSRDMNKIKEIKDVEEKRKWINTIYEKYHDFIKGIWEKADIDEKAYQMKIKDIFPADIQETIEFSEFLNFSTTKKIGHTRDLDPRPDPTPAGICIDALQFYFGLQAVDKGGDANSFIIVTPTYMNVSANAAVAGFSQVEGIIASDINIPGTFPDDSRLLRVQKSYQWMAYATAVSVIGCSFATMSTSTVMNEEYIRMWAPVTWISTKEVDELKTEDYEINKRFMFNIRYGVEAYSDAFGEIAAGGVSGSTCDHFTWNVCEE
jgi:hypothetical protein